MIDTQSNHDDYALCEEAGLADERAAPGGIPLDAFWAMLDPTPDARP